jgi:hypothetical protein
MWENSLLWSLLTRDVTWPFPFLRHPSVYSCCLATNEARQCDVISGSTRPCSAWRKHNFVYCCVIVGACFDVTVLAWRKYATIYYCVSVLAAWLRVRVHMCLLSWKNWNITLCVLRMKNKLLLC